MSERIFSIVGSALKAQECAMGAIASNLANAASVAAAGQQPYRAQEVVFRPRHGGWGNDGDGTGDAADATALGVHVVATVQSNAPPNQTYDPGNPYADAQGYVTGSNVSPVDEMVNMIDSSNSYAASVAVLQQASRIDQQMLCQLSGGLMTISPFQARPAPSAYGGLRSRPPPRPARCLRRRPARADAV